MRKKFKCFTTKNQITIKEDTNAGNEEQKSCKEYRKQIAKWQRSKPLLISNYFKCKYIKYSNQKTQTDRKDKPMWSKLYAIFKRLTFLKNTNILNVKEWKKIVHANSNQKTARVAILISEKIDFKSKISWKKQRRTVCVDKSFSTSRIRYNYKHLHT